MMVEEFDASKVKAISVDSLAVGSKIYLVLEDGSRIWAGGRVTGEWVYADIWKRENLPNSIKEIWDHEPVGHTWLDNLRGELHRLKEYINAHQLIVNQFAYHDEKYWWKGEDLGEMKRKADIFDGWEEGRCGYFKPGYGCDSPTGIGNSVMCRKLPTCEVLTDELLWKQVKAARDKLYEDLPTGDIDSFALLKVIKAHVTLLDEILEDK